MSYFDDSLLRTLENMQGPIHGIGDPYALEVEDVKWAINPYFVLSASSFFLVCPHLIHLFCNKMMMPRHKKFGSHLCTLWVCNRKYIWYPSLYYMPKACIICHKICVWAASRCIQSSPNTSWSHNWAVREKRSSQYFCTVYNKDPLQV